ncbi:MAG: 4Fe-4S dicluster domain-containing protein [Clostridia bacterium]|nr:4Fe-4S dicluster domain-containing protein [Clostridia bacterium]
MKNRDKAFETSCRGIMKGRLVCMKLDELQKLIYEAGIVGAGGAGFPTHKKLSEQVKTIVVNAAECEPLMMVDHHLLHKHLQELVDTLEILIDTLGAEEAIIGIKGKNMHLLDESIVAKLKTSKIKIKEIPDIYPAGDEVVLTYETTGKIIPEGSIPIMVGVMVINVETIYNIYLAIKKGQPVIDKYITIGGDTKEDITVKAPIGMKISEVLTKSGYTDLKGKAVINGGPMMGKLVDLENDVVTKTTKGLLIFPEYHQVIQRRRMSPSVTLKRASSACCQCRMCSEVCPRYLLGYSLEVHKTVRAAANGTVSDTESFLQNALCCGCGVCTVMGCQQMINPQGIATEIKGALAKNGLRRQNNKAPEKVRDERASRLVSSERLIERLGIKRYVKKNVERRNVEFSPNEVCIPFSQHVGKPASAVVKVGDMVKVGQIVAQTEYEALGTTMHASIDGKVKAITDRFVIIGKE